MFLAYNVHQKARKHDVDDLIHTHTRTRQSSDYHIYQFYGILFSQGVFERLLHWYTQIHVYYSLSIPNIINEEEHSWTTYKVNIVHRSMGDLIK